MADEINVLKSRIHISEIKEGMVIAADVVTPNGLLLIPKNMQILDNHIHSLEIYNIHYVYVFDEIEPIHYINELIADNYTLEFMNNKDFKVFQENYSKTIVLTKQYLTTISLGYEVHIDDLCNLSKNLLNNLFTYGDLFSYLYHLKSYDDYTFTHCLNVSMLCFIFGRWLRLPEEELKNLTVSGLLHDIGKVSINYDLLNKPGKLSPEEFEAIKSHPQKGYEMIKDQNFSENVKLAVLQHHEKSDGSGYPNGLTGENLSDFGKIVAITDIYDAMTSDRSYHKKASPFKVIKFFESETFKTLDMTYLYIFLTNIAQNFIGSTVLLSNNEIGKIIFIHKEAPSRPMVAAGNSIYNLFTDPSIEIVQLL